MSKFRVLEPIKCGGKFHQLDDEVEIDDKDLAKDLKERGLIGPLKKAAASEKEAAEPADAKADKPADADKAGEGKKAAASEKK